jgi:F-type H+-transporting ATPase subunit b
MGVVFLLAEAGTGGGVQQIANTFGVDWPHLLSQIISFAIVCLLLQRFAYKPIVKLLEARRAQIAEGIAEREKIRNEMAQAQARRQEIIVSADAEASAMVEEAHTAAAAVRERETQKAMTEAEQIVLKSREAAVQEHARMLRGLKEELGALVVQATGVATGKVLTADDQKRLAQETLNQVKKAA